MHVSDSPCYAGQLQYNVSSYEVVLSAEALVIEGAPWQPLSPAHGATGPPPRVQDLYVISFLTYRSLSPNGGRQDPVAPHDRHPYLKYFQTDIYF